MGFFNFRCHSTYWCARARCGTTAGGYGCCAYCQKRPTTTLRLVSASTIYPLATSINLARCSQRNLYHHDKDPRTTALRTLKSIPWTLLAMGAISTRPISCILARRTTSLMVMVLINRLNSCVPCLHIPVPPFACLLKQFVLHSFPSSLSPLKLYSQTIRFQHALMFERSNTLS